MFESVTGRRREREAVTLGAERDGNVVIKNGLTGTELIVSKPPDAMKAGDKVHVKG